MKSMLWLFLLALAVPTVAHASSSADFSNSGGTLAGSNSGLSLSGSTLVAVNGLSGLGLVTGNLGSVAFSTGALTGGSLQMGGTFAAGGSFVITGDGFGGIPNGTMFTGTFSGPLTWTLITLANGTHNYTLTGTVTGTWVPTGATVQGATVVLTVNVGKGFFTGSTLLSSGDTNLTGQGTTFGTVPEPSSLALLGTGLISLAGVCKSRLKRKLAEREQSTVEVISR